MIDDYCKETNFEFMSEWMVVLVLANESKKGSVGDVVTAVS